MAVVLLCLAVAAAAFAGSLGGVYAGLRIGGRALVDMLKELDKL